MKIIGIGDNVVDVYLNQKTMYPGGNSVNVPVLACRAGAERAAYIGIVGNDGAGKHLVSSLEAEGVDLSRLRTACGENGYNIIKLNDENDRMFIGGNDGGVQRYLQLKLDQEDYSFISKFQLIHTSVHSHIEYCLPKLAEVLPISMDFSDGFNRENIKQLCPYLKIAFFSGGHMNQDEIEDLMAYAHQSGAQTVVVTRGKRGSLVLDNSGKHRQGIIEADVIDTLGAGDAYIAGFLVKFFETGDIPHAAEFGAASASKACGYFGAFGYGADVGFDIPEFYYQSQK